MSTSSDDVRRIALALPSAVQDGDELRYLVAGGKAFAWTWKKRVDPKRARVEQRDVYAVRVSGEEEKQALLAADPAAFFTEPHYAGYPAVLVRLAAIDEDELTELLTDAWRAAAPRRLLS
ncbi:MAG: hypothetical protein QOI71_562 [Gaiellales bacterium]|nr:hypothetical protein [Gaiellales bacterium]